VVKAVEFFAGISSAKPINVTDSKGHNDTLTRNPSMGNLLSGNLVKIPLPPAVTDAAHPFTLFFDNNSMEDLWMAITWGG
jgi:hypothetical protein